MAQLEVGLLWYDNDRKCTLTSKVERAVRRYQAKFGCRPDLCYVHQESLDGETEWQGVRIVGAPNVLPDHFWVGVAGRPAPARKTAGRAEAHASDARAEKRSGPTNPDLFSALASLLP